MCRNGIKDKRESLASDRRVISPPVPGSRVSASRLSTHTNTQHNFISWTETLGATSEELLCFYHSVLFIGVGVIKGRDLGRNKSAVCLCELSLAPERKKTIESSARSGPLSPCQTVSIGAGRRAAGARQTQVCARVLLMQTFGVFCDFFNLVPPRPPTGVRRSR